MASKRLSPAANLLRRSKLFALPRPLKAPSTQNNASRRSRTSDTATLHHPTNIALETTSDALRFGDWGLKRALPRKAGRSSTPVVRINAIDTAEHITDYASAADHTLTLEKWQEMDIPIRLDQPRNEQEMGILSQESRRSAFEETPRATISRGSSSVGNDEWRVHGPWILGMTDYEFARYIDESLRTRRTEFLAFVRRHLEEEHSTARRKSMLLQEGNALPVLTPFTETDFVEGIRRLRTERLELWRLMWRFLDIPGDPPTVDGNNANYAALVNRMLSDADTAPPQTHPSAGLAYTRTNSHLYNHPTLGPQRSRPPVRARIIQHGSLSRPHLDNRSHLFGVGGVVGSESSGSFGFVENSRAGEQRFDIDAEGGDKVWVHPKRAVVESNGRIKLEVERANADVVAVWEQQVPPGTVLDADDPLAALVGAEKRDKAVQP